MRWLQGGSIVSKRKAMNREELINILNKLLEFNLIAPHEALLIMKKRDDLERGKNVKKETI